MQSTGGEKFTCYVYYKTKKYEANDAATWTDSSSDENASDDNDEDEESSNEAPVVEPIKILKK